MGRTLPTFTRLIQQEKAAWKEYRDALPEEDRQYLDAFFRAAKYHVAPGSYASKSSPLETMMVAMLIETYKKNDLLQARVSRLESLISEKKPSPE